MSSTNHNAYEKLLAAPPSNYEDDLPAPVDLEFDTQAQWSSGLSNCCSNVPLCCITCWCPCVTFGRIAEAVDDGKTSCVTSATIYAFFTYATGCGWIYSLTYRSKLRKQYMLGASAFQDCLAHFCCERCALCQEYRELQHRSVADAGEKKDGVEVVPMVPNGMTR
ncbi:cell number regulator 10-like isoform X2 [Bidens hawaiensis]|uniref:cell number regulator 10-like isoform X2 n=1 Tax=Bidens hawaiensis TaxID=980011 RepID=UPI00404AB4B7